MSEIKRTAVIDLGSHSALLLIAEVERGGTLKILKEDFKVTRLGLGLGSEGRLLPQQQETALARLREFKHTIAGFGEVPVTVLATEALRRALNADAFLQSVQRELGWKVRVLTPQEEARYSYLGAISVYEDFKAKLFTVIDVGGGSTEIVRGRGEKIEMSRSFPVGAVGLAEQLHFRERIVSGDIPAIQEFLDARFNESELKKFTDEAILVGVGGTITTAAAIHERMTKYDPERINRTSLTLDELLLLFEDLNAKSPEERRAVVGLEAGREDVIIYGLIIYIHLLQRSGVWRIKVSARGLRHGFLLAEISR